MFFYRFIELTSDVKTVTVAFLFFFWITGLFWQFLELEEIVRAVELLSSFLVIYYLLFSKYSISRVRLYFCLTSYLVLLFTISYLRDIEASYKTVLFLKTIYYVFFGILAGVSFNDYFSKSEKRKEVFCRCLSIFSILLIFCVLYLAIRESWLPGRTLLGTSIGESYQGISRNVSLCILIIACLYRYLLSWIAIPCVFLGLLILFSLNSFGAFFGVILSMLILFRQHKGFLRILFLVICVVITLWLASLLINFSDVFLAESFWGRLQNKFLLQSLDVEENRLWLMIAGFNCWTSDVYSLIFGYGPMKYACLVGYCGGYRHPHNLFVALFVWFGLLGIPLLLVLLKTSWKTFFYFFQSNDSLVITISALGLNYISLAFIGGDFEQNRHLIFVFSIIFCLDPSGKSAVWKQINRV